MPLEREGSYKEKQKSNSAGSGGRKRSLKKGDSHSISSVLPATFQARLHDLFGQIEKEFEVLYLENLTLREKIDGFSLVSNTTTGTVGSGVPHNPATAFHPTPTTFGGDSLDGIGTGSTPASSAHHGGKGSLKIGSSSGSVTHKGSGIPSSQQKVALRLKAQTSRIVSSFKANTYSCGLVREFYGHRDGIWDVYPSKVPLPGSLVVGTASADHKAGVFSVDSGKCLLRYEGHKGSCNSIRFHPTRELALTASGDHTAHLWQCSVSWDTTANINMIPGQKTGVSSEEELESSEKEDTIDGGVSGLGESSVCGGGGIDYHSSIPAMRTPSTILSGHANVIICADFLAGGEQLITASWDRLAALWDATTGERVQSFSGHDQELSYCTTHPVQKLVVTTSRDATFRMWDLRSSSCQSVSVFQGHTDNVTSARFTRDEKLVSGSDDKTVKIWDIRNMRAALVTIRTDSPVNRLSLSSTGLIAVPQDDRHVRIFDMSGQRVARLPRSNRQGHRRMVTSSAWTEDPKCNLLTCGFDRVVMGWSVQLNKDKEKEKD